MKRTVIFIALFVLLSCGGIKRDADAIFTRLETEDPWIARNADSPAFLRSAIEEHPDVKALILLGPDAARLALQRFGMPDLKNADEALACYAYIVEWHRLSEGIPVLEQFVRSSPGRQGFVVSPLFAIRSLLVLKELPDPTGGYDGYTTEDVRRAMRPAQPP